MKHVILACALSVMAITPVPADEQDDLAVAERFLNAIEIGKASADAAMDRANSALVGIMAQTPDARIGGSDWGLNACLPEVRKVFRQSCAFDRSRSPGQEFFLTDEQLTAKGCLTRDEAIANDCRSLLRMCDEQLPNAVPHRDMARCLTENPRAESLRNNLFELFFDEEVEKRLEGVDPEEREVIRSQIGPTDV
ncbi:MAG: hypothetical protein F4Z55_00880 [Boseongicola sp. SB0667_bin_21]|nr:hypothetical protein [Boseongicola sp. SB0667_bin_21]